MFSSWVMKFWYNIRYVFKKKQALKDLKAWEKTFAECESLDDISKQLSIAPLRWKSDYFGGTLDNISEPWVTLAAKGGDCDSLARLWSHLLEFCPIVTDVYQFAMVEGVRGHVVVVFKMRDNHRWFVISNFFLLGSTYVKFSTIGDRFYRYFSHGYLYDNNLKLIQIVKPGD